QQGDSYRQVAHFGQPPELDQFMRDHPLEISRGTITGRTVIERRTIHIPDVQADPEYTFFEAMNVGHIRTMVGVPLLRSGVPIGVIVLQRKRVRPFTDREIELLTTFADQAVIAIENVRLFDEVQAGTRELSDALERQTATGEVLASISKSVADERPVFEAIVNNLRRLLRTPMATVLVLKDGVIHLAAASHEREFEVMNRQFPAAADDSTGGGRAMLLKRVLQFAPILNNPAAPPTTERFARELGFNAAIFAPMIREDKVVGAIGTARRGSVPFDDKQVALIRSCADQAVIAIENKRLFDEVQARTNELARSVEGLRALGEVTQAVNSSLDLETVLSTLVAKAER